MTRFLSVTLFIVLTGGAFSCKQADDQHLPPAKMEQIMFDIGIAESYSTKSKDNTNFGGIKNIDSLAVYYTDILAHHKVTPAEFRQSLNWYKKHPDDMDSLYTHLTIKADQLNAEESRRKKLMAPATPPPVPTQTMAPSPGGTVKPQSGPAMHM